MYENELIQEIQKAESRIFWNVVVHFPKINAHCTVKRNDAFDQVEINYQDDKPAKYISLISSVQKSLKAIDKIESIERVLGGEVAEFYRKREESLFRLEELSQKLIEQNEQYRRHLDQQNADRSQKLEADTEMQRKSLEEIFLTKRNELTDREQKLEERTKQLDDRSSRHARRQLRQDLKSELAKRSQMFSLTQGTTSKRVPIHLLFGVLIAIPMFVFAQSFYYGLTHTDGSISWVLVTKSLMSASATAAAIIYYIKWTNDWFDQHAEEEFHLKRLELDIDRASWVVEMALEWRDEKGAEIPTELIDRLSRNLFVSESIDRKGLSHPTQDLASALLDASTNLSLRFPGFAEARFDRKGLKNFKRETINKPPIESMTV